MNGRSVVSKDAEVASSLVLLERDRTLIAENHIMKSVATFQNMLCEFQPLHLVGVSDELTIGSLL